MKIFLDFDDTLFDTQGFKRDLWTLFERAEFSVKEIENAYALFVGAGNGGGFVYSPQVHLKYMQEQRGIEVDAGNRELEEFLSQDMSQYVYSDSIDFCSCFKKKDMAILSFGDNSFQRHKIFKSGMESRVENVFITQVEKSKIIVQVCTEGDGDIYFLDNTPMVIDEVKRSLPWVKTILVSRPEGRYHDAKTKWCDFEVHDLDSARKIITG